MGNEKSKQLKTGGRGVALGSSPSPSKPIKTSGNRSSSSANTTPSTSNTSIAANRIKLVQTKPKNVNELAKKQKILDVMKQADHRRDGNVDAIVQQPFAQDTETIQANAEKAMKMQRNAPKEKDSSSSLYMADPSKKEAMAAETRLKTKTQTSDLQRKAKTRDLLFGDGLTRADDVPNSTSQNVVKGKKPATVEKKDVNSIWVKDGMAADAAMSRINQKMKVDKVTGKERKQRTIDLLHGDALKTEEIKTDHASHKQQNQEYFDMEPEVALVHQSLLNLVNFNTNDKTPTTAKLLRKIITKILEANSAEEQEKFGKLRLSQPKIKAAFVDMQCGLEMLETMGFKKVKIEKDGKIEDYMQYNYSLGNSKALNHVIKMIDIHYPEIE